MSPSSRRSVLQAAAAGSVGLVAGCSALGTGSEPPVDISVLNSTPAPVTIELEVVEDASSETSMLFSETFELSAYKPGTRTRNSDADRQNAFQASEATVICKAYGNREQFSFEASCVDSESGIDEGFTVEWADDGDRGDELRYRQSRC